MGSETSRLREQVADLIIELQTCKDGSNIEDLNKRLKSCQSDIESHKQDFKVQQDLLKQLQETYTEQTQRMQKEILKLKRRE